MKQLLDADHLALVTRVARNIHRRLPAKVELSDLINDGYLGLISAKANFDPSRETAFRFFAARRIRGAILDGLRQRNPLPRIRRQAETLPWIIHLRDTPSPVAAFEEAVSLRNEIDALLLSLPDRIWFVLQLYYYEKFPMKQIGDYLGITEAGVSLICSRAVNRIRKSLE
jgi:RNA polymerase sigma factor for flagellar operon FliA